MDTDHPVEILAYDEAFGVGVFSIPFALNPWPGYMMATEVSVGDELEELILANRQGRKCRHSL
jgi:hypothetical protein